MKIIIQDPSMAKLEDITALGCEDFWNAIRDENLYDNFTRAVEEFFPDGISLNKLNDLIRFDKEFLDDVRKF